MISWCRNRAFSARSSDFPLVMSASMPSTREVVDGLSQREKHSWSVRQLEQICCLIKVNTQPTKLNLSFVKISTWPESTREWTVLIVLASHRLGQGGVFYRVQYANFLNRCPK